MSPFLIIFAHLKAYSIKSKQICRLQAVDLSPSYVLEWIDMHVGSWQDLIGSSAALCENMGHTYSSMGNYDEVTWLLRR